MKKFYIWLVVGLCGLLLGRFISEWPDGKLRLVQCDVGQGDAILITRGFSQFLIDAGKGDEVLACLEKYMPFWDRQLDFVMATHADIDHIGGFDDILKRYRTDIFLFNGRGDSSSAWSSLLRLLTEKKVKTQVFGQNTVIMAGELVFEGLWPGKRDAKNLVDSEDDFASIASKQLSNGVASKMEENGNENSIVLRFSYEKFEALLTGDIPDWVEKQLIDEVELKSLLLKVSHHGSRSSSGKEFIEAVKPRVATIGVGENSYGHPHVEVMELLEEASVKVYRTDEDGDVVVVTDGARWWRE